MNTPDSPPTFSLPTKAQIKSILRFLPAFGHPTEPPSDWEQTAPEKFTYRGTTGEAAALQSALHKEGFNHVGFPYMQWLDAGGRRYMKTPKLIATADLLTLCRIITVHLRGERFCWGYFSSLLSNGQMAAILQRLAAIYSEMDEGIKASDPDSSDSDSNQFSG